MPRVKFLPRRLDMAMSRLARSENIKDLLVHTVNPAYTVWADDFVGSPTGTWPANANWMYPATVGTGTEVIGITAALGGTLTCTTGGTSGNGAYQYVGRNWRGTDGIYFIARVKIDDITTSKFEVGLTDSITNEGAIATKATPTFTASDCAVFVRDTSDDTNLTFITAAGGTVGANADATFTVASDTYMTLEIVVQGGFASGYVNGALVGSGAVTATTTLTPGFGATTRAAATRTLTVDYGVCVGPKL